MIGTDPFYRRRGQPSPYSMGQPQGGFRAGGGGNLDPAGVMGGHPSHASTGQIAGSRGYSHVTPSGATQPYLHKGDLRGGARVGLLLAARSHGQRGVTGASY